MRIRRLAVVCLTALPVLLGSCSGSDATGVKNREVQIAVQGGNQQNGTVGADLPLPVAVKVTDLLGDPISNQVVNFIVLAGGGDATRTVRTDGSGIASGVWQLGTLAGSPQQLEARTLSSDGTRKTVTLTATAVADVPDTITAVSAVQLSAAAGTAVRTRPSVRLADQYGNLVTGYPVSFSVTQGGGTVAGGTASSDGQGIATVQRWTLGPVQGLNLLAASVPSIGGAVQFNATGTSPVASKVGLVTQPASVAQSGSPLTRQPVAQLVNTSGDPIPQSGTPVTASLLSGTGLLLGTATVTTDTAGMATFTDLAIGGTVGNFTLRFDAAALASDTSDLVALAPGPATTLAPEAGTVPPSINAGSLVPVPPAITLTDDWGNGIPGMSVTFTVTSGGGSITGGNQVTGGNGVATVSSWRLGPLPGSNSLSATVNTPGISGNPVTFTATGNGDFWSSRASMTTPRRFTAFATASGLIYTVGGKNASLVETAVVEVYNPSVDSWSPRASMSTARVGAAAGFIGNKMYVAGGTGSTNHALATGEAFSLNNTWAPIASMPVPRNFPAFGVLNGELIVAGGGDDNGQLGSVYGYDPVSNSWNQKADLPALRNDAVGVVLNGLFYVVGGQVGNNPDGALLVYDPGTDTWTPLASMPTHRYHVNAEVLNGKIYVVSGLLQGGNASPVVEVYDPGTDTWSPASDITTARSAGAISVVNGILYVLGGSANNTVTGVVEAYVP